MTPAHTPYDGSSKPFTIGLKPLDRREWIEVDGRLEDYLTEKDRLLAAVPELVFAAEPDTEAAQREVLELLIEHLPKRFPEIYTREGGTVRIGCAGRAVDLDAPAAPLMTAAKLVQEDLVLMRKGADGWRLAAASLSFPSSWSLMEKFGRPLDDIHAPVPAFGRGTRMAELIARMFDNLRVEQPVLRMNWSLQGDAALYLPMSSRDRDERATARPPRFPQEDTLSGAIIRVERQTLRKLPVSGDILFTIRIHLNPMETLARHAERGRLAAAFAAQLDALDGAQLDYRGLTADRERLAAALRLLQSG